MDASDWDSWVATAKQSPDALTKESFASLAAPSEAGPARYYGTVSLTLDDVIHAATGMLH